MKRRVVITGMGIYSCLGKTLEEVKTSLYEGKSGIIFDPARKDLAATATIRYNRRIDKTKPRTNERTGLLMHQL